MKKLFPKRKPLTEKEVNELRRRYKKFCEENNNKLYNIGTDGFVEGSLDNLKQ